MWYNLGMTKNTLFIVLLLVIILAGGALLYWNTPVSNPLENAPQHTEQPANGTSSPQEPNSRPSTPSSPAPTPSPSVKSGTGRLIFTITDDTIPIQDVSSVLFTMNSLSVRDANAKWVALSNKKHTYDLLQLKREGKLELVFDTNIPASTYDQLSLVLDSVVIVKNGIAQTAKFPSNTMYIPLSLPLRANQTAAISLDIIADKSLHTTNTERLIFAPVIEITVLGEIQTVQKSGSKVEFFNGLPKFIGSYGMDETGVMWKNSTGIDSLSRIELEGNIFVIIPHSLDRSLFTVAPAEAINTALNGGYISRVTAVYAEQLEKKPVWRVNGVASSGTVTAVYVNAKTGVIQKVQ